MSEFFVFLGAFLKLRKVGISFVMSARFSVASVRMEKLDTYWTDLREILYSEHLLKSVDKIQFALKLDKNVGNFL
jgi:hypothetical protein